MLTQIHVLQVKINPKRTSTRTEKNWIINLTTQIKNDQSEQQYVSIGVSSSSDAILLSLLTTLQKTTINWSSRIYQYQLAAGWRSKFFAHRCVRDDWRLAFCVTGIQMKFGLHPYTVDQNATPYLPFENINYYLI